MKRKQIVMSLVMAIPAFGMMACNNVNDTRTQLDEADDISIEESIGQVATIDEADSNQRQASLNEYIDSEMTDVNELKNDQLVNEEVIQPINGKLYFGRSVSDVKQSDYESLLSHAEYLINQPHMKLIITGHTDKSGSAEFNKFLAKKRADAVVQVLIEYGVDPKQLKVLSMGEERALTDLEYSIEDRRVELVYVEEVLADETQTSEDQVSELKNF